MLKQISIQNLAIFDDLTIEFDDNFNVMSGETGAGKSIIIGALNLALGKRASMEDIRYGQSSATIQALFYLSPVLSKRISDVINIEIDEELIIYRNINQNGRSVCKINNTLVSVATLNQLSENLIDIHSQHESQYLLNSKYHLDLLDQFILSQDKNFLDDYKIKYLKYLEKKQELKVFENTNVANYDLEYLKYQIDELNDFNYSLSDIEAIFDEFKKMQEVEKNSSLIANVLEELNGSESVISKLYNVKKNISKLDQIAKNNDFYERIDSLYIDINDFYETFKYEYDFSNFDDNRFEYLKDEISKINRLRRKYNTDDILKIKQEFVEKYNMLINYEENLLSIKNEISILFDECNNLAEKVNIKRNKYKKILEKEIINHLKDLYLENAQFEIRLDKISELKISGNVNCEFYLSTNPGNPMRSLSKVASGGEISRVMLGLKCSFAKYNLVDLYVFDEIDTGVSGKVATAMGEKMLSIGKNRQVIAITHLPQVVACGDYNYYIMKNINNNETKTSVLKLDNNGKINEVARLLSGDKITENSLSLAKELINSK